MTVSVRAVKLYDFDATALSRDPRVVAERLHIYRVTAVDYIVEGYSGWTEFAQSFDISKTSFAWPSVYTFHPDATTIVVGFGPILQAIVQFYPERHVRCPSGHRAPITYVTFLEVAPWNRTDYSGRKFGGLGSLLLQYVSARTFATGQGGALGLHSLPEAAGFYERLGFSALDCPNEHHELYMELDETRAEKFRTRGGF